MKKSSDQLIKRIEVQGTPFMIVETKDQGCFIHMGAFRVSKVYRTVAECRKVIKLKPWDVIASVALAMATNEIEKYKEQIALEASKAQKPTTEDIQNYQELIKTQDGNN